MVTVTLKHDLIYILKIVQEIHCKKLKTMYFPNLPKKQWDALMSASITKSNIALEQQQDWFQMPPPTHTHFCVFSLFRFEFVI